jgi:hypothetical protein
MKPRRALLVLPFCLLGDSASVAVVAQETRAGLRSLDDFVSEARAATAKFHDPATAAREGYRRIGPDFPTLGQHWVNPSLVLAGEFDPARPSVLAYAEIDGVQTIVKVAYALPVDGPDTTAQYPWLDGAWRYIDGNLAEAGLPGLEEPASTAETDRATGLRIAVVHAWTGLDNPAGMLEMHNWTLPFERLDLAAPSEIEPDAAHALGLLSGAGGYYRSVLLALGDPTETEIVAIDTLMNEARRTVGAWLERHRSSPDLTGDLEALAGIWRKLETDVLKQVGSATRERLERLFAALDEF